MRKLSISTEKLVFLIISGLTVLALAFIFVFAFKEQEISKNIVVYKASDQNLPQIKLSKTFADLGTMKVNDEKTTVFQLKNSGTKPLQFFNVTSSCCAPVLFAAITLSSLSPSIITSFIVSLTYILGMVFPLFFLSLFYEKLTNQSLYKIKKSFAKPLKILASLTFMASSLIIAYLALTNRLQMDQNKTYGLMLRDLIFNLSSRLQNPLIDLVFLIILAFFLKLLIAELRRERKI